ncbi:hypothetical protein DOY81_001612 [Sarcophaga bullata]|nr:hypothetical protein DOY81_001612 [Sarcophaga bullata]
MVYNTKEFQYLKPKNTSYLQTFNIPTTANRRNKAVITPIHTPSKSPVKLNSIVKTETKSLWNLLYPYCKEYCRISSIHCFSYFANDKLKYYEKLIWLLIIVTTSVCCIIVYFDLAELYYTQRLQTTVADSVYPVFTVPFPSVAICLRNRIDWPRLHSSAAQRFLPPDADNETLHTFYRFFESLADIKFYSLHRLAPLFKGPTKVNLSLIAGVDVLAVMKYLLFPCSEVFNSFCNWRFKSYNCCELFTVERTEMGFCYVFNSGISEKAQEKAKNDPFYPYHNSYAGESSGLELEVLLNENKMKPGTKMINGLYIMIKQSEQWHSDVKFINYNTFAKLALTAQLTETDNRIRLITPVARGCIFDDESSHPLYNKIPGLVYWRGNCRTRCHQDRETHIFESKYIDDVGNDSMTCNCLNSCNQLIYHAFYSSFPLEGINHLDPIKMVHLDIHFQTAYILKYRTAMRYTFVELLANFGGIIGLFLGASLLSATELFYHFTIGLYFRLHKQLEERYRKKSTNSSKRYGKPKIVKISSIEPNEVFKY